MGRYDGEDYDESYYQQKRIERLTAERDRLQGRLDHITEYVKFRRGSDYAAMREILGMDPSPAARGSVTGDDTGGHADEPDE